ncbi:ABC1 kinase family protein [Haliangium ochraceum]|uniref:ABC-1 domain protein n=1 Tax=Haliangium ochraceum (strain DSM 14365 / JCM 11303 / SMP-2) TaxID=502025 RepID=D0LUT3_HALO1|nr:AarF/ABC1/UbiB kinase family protein [Haliangium ochraceum]ACY13973.1 ABC-1 domain protein [Haliangium ochraceum DSM 14365]
MRWLKRLGARTRVASRALAARAHQILTTDPGSLPDQGERVQAQAQADEAARLGAGLLKIAQVSGYLESFDLGGDARAALAALWDHAPSVPASAAAAVVRAELGAPPQQLFARWAEQPLASASLGQVHAAADTGGAEYAVKVQYPEVAEALRQDLASPALVKRLAGTELGRRLEPQAIERLRAAVLAELDYRHEAAAAERFRAALAGEPDMVVPAVDLDRSSARVLTMERIDGVSIEASAHAEPAQRRAAADSILRFAWIAPLRHGLVHADPNPGNFLVLAQPTRVAFLDFGCTGELAPEDREGERALWNGLMHHDPFTAAETFRVGLGRGGMVRNASVFFQQTYRDWERLVTAPYTSRERFAWTSDYAASLVEATRDLVGAGVLRLPGPRLLLWRQRLGVAAVLGMLDIDVDARAALTAALA